MVEQLGKYMLLDRINHGGMADVFLAKAFGFGGANQIIAIKSIRPEISEDPNFVEMFINEAKLTVLLTHANIAQVFELGRTDLSYYIAMEYVPGCDLRAIVDRCKHRALPLPFHLVLTITAQILEGLDYAHRKKDPTGVPLHIVHQDVSPHNVLVGYEGEVKLIDFGIAKAATHASQGQSGVLKGKYGYMSPEQVVGKSLDARSDIFSTGVLLYELLTQQRLFDGASDFSILAKVRHAEIYPPTSLNPMIPDAIEAIVLRALSLDPDRRYQTASEMHDAVVETMLREYGQPLPRELAHLMASLFPEEIQANARLLEKARQINRLTDISPIAITKPERLRSHETVTGRPQANAIARPAHDESDTDPEYPAQGQAESQGDNKADPRTHPDAAYEADSEADDTRPEIIISRPLPESSQIRTNPLHQLQAQPADPTPREVTSRVQFPLHAVPVNPTEVMTAYRRPWTQDRWIVLSAIVGALFIIVLSWWITQPPEKEQGERVVILSVPTGATLFVDDKAVGQTPYTTSTLPVGQHRIRLELEGYHAEYRTVTVNPSETLSLQILMHAVE